MATTRLLTAASLLLAAAHLPAAAPPPADPLPPGCIARLGHARMVASDRAGLMVSPDGKHIRAAWSHYGEESSLPVQWFRVSDGRDAPPIRPPGGFQLRRVFANGSYLAGDKGRLLHFASAEAPRPRAVIESSYNVRVFFDRAGRSCVRSDVGEGQSVLWAASLRGELRWRRIATVKGGVLAVMLSDEGSHAVWWQNGDFHVHDLRAGT